MAITAAIVATPSTANTLQKVACALTVTNSGTPTVYVTGVAPFAEKSGATQGSVPVQVGMPNLGPGMPTAVAGSSGTLVINFDVVPMAPNVAVYNSNPFPSAGVGGVAITPLQPESQPVQQLYDIGATVYTSDGSVTAATVATVTVNAVKP